MTGRLAVVLVLALQLVCGLFLLRDIAFSVLGLTAAPISWALYELIEIGALLGLLLGAVVTAVLLSRSIRKQRQAEESLRLASGAFMEVLTERFDDWSLTPAERDVALFCIKGLSTAEIASLRNTAEGTVKSQTNAIFRKAGVSGRPQLLSLFIDEMMGGDLPARVSDLA